MSYAAESRIDWLINIAARRLAQRTSRRHILARLGTALVGGALFPLLPVVRNAANATSFAGQAQADDETQCNYWRYCAIDGNLCSCCGGSVNSCPPGTISPPTAWVGSCVDPRDGQAYLVIYRDCCGKEICNRCSCAATEGEMPVYRPQLNGDIIWCFGTDQMTYHCTHAALLGKA